MSVRHFLIVALIFGAGLAAGVGVNRWALGPAASIPSPKPSVRERIIGRWNAISNDGESSIEFGPDNTITAISSGQQQVVSFQWFDDEHIGICGKKQYWMRVTLRDDHLTLDPGADGEILKCKRATPPVEQHKSE